MAALIISIVGLLVGLMALCLAWSSYHRRSQPIVREAAVVGTTLGNTGRAVGTKTGQA